GRPDRAAVGSAAEQTHERIATAARVVGERRFRGRLGRRRRRRGGLRGDDAQQQQERDHHRQLALRAERRERAEAAGGADGSCRTNVMAVQSTLMVEPGCGASFALICTSPMLMIREYFAMRSKN